MLNFKSTADYLKYTVTLAGAGFVYSNGVLAQRPDLFGVLGAKWLVAVLLTLFLLRAVFAVFAISGIVRYENEVARAVKSPPGEAAEAARKSVERSGAWHLGLLIFGFLVALVFFVDQFFRAAEKAEAERCALTTGALTLSFDCEAEVVDALERARIGMALRWAKNQ